MCVCCQVIHDYDHVGYTNDYLVNSGSLLALRYGAAATRIGRGGPGEVQDKGSRIGCGGGQGRSRIRSGQIA